MVNTKGIVKGLQFQNTLINQYNCRKDLELEIENIDFVEQVFSDAFF